MESLRRALSRGGLRKNAESAQHVQKSDEKKWFLVSNLPLCFRPTLKQGSARFTIGQTRVSGFGLKCTGILDRAFGKKSPIFSSVTLEKKRVVVFSGSRHPESFRPNPQTRVAPINAQRHPCLRVWSETHSIPLIEISFLKKASFSLQNSALIAVLIVKGREVVF